jgi:uncharacterized protein (TIGR03382 family)
LLAAAAVAGAAIGSAYGGMVVTPSAPTSTQIPLNTPGNVVFSLRNTGSTGVAITSLDAAVVATLAGSAAVNDCPMMSLVPINGYAYGNTIPPGGQAQFEVRATGFPAAGQYSCTYNITTGTPTTNPSVTVTFDVVATAGVVSLQEQAVDFGTQAAPAFETQEMLLTNYGTVTSPSMQLVISNDPTNTLAFTNGCAGQSCTIVTPAVKVEQPVYVKCQPMTTGFVSGFVLVVNGSNGAVASAPVQCSALFGTGSAGMLHVTNPIVIPAPPAMTGTATGTVSTSNPNTTMLTSETLSGTDLSAYGLIDCGGGTSCSTTIPLSTSMMYGLAVTCDRAINDAPPPAMLTVTDDTGDTATAQVTCGTGMGSGSSGNVPQLAVDKSIVQFGNVLVHGSRSDWLTIYNVNGTTTSLDNIVVTVGGTNPSEFDVATSCTVSTPCSIPIAGTPITIPLTFLPTVHGLEDATITVTSNGGTASVSLAGTGLGAVMSLDAQTIDFGTLGLGQTVPMTVNVLDGGNFAPMPFSVVTPAPPYAVAPGTGNVDPGTPFPVTISCGSNAPSADNNPQTILFNSTDPPTYLGAMQTVSVTCTIADTQLQVLTPPFDFHEVRIGTSAPAIPITLLNPSTATATATLQSVALESPKTGLMLVPPAPLPQALAAGSSAMATLQLDTSAETDLTGEFLDVMVDGKALQFPVSGKVVTPKSRIAPAQLDLGTACVGTQVSGNVMLVNEGTATLTVFRPTTDSGFTALTPTMIPDAGVKLPAGMSSVATVTPSASATGTVTGMLEWKDDVPSDYKVPVTLDYVTSGTAISPAALDFGSVEVGSASESQMVTAQNCEFDPKPFKIKALRGKDGSGPIGAWKIQPAVGFSTMLGAHDVQVITAHFDPPGRGHYEADLELETDAGPQTIHLVADATGRDFDRTSVYACSCATGDVASGWPIALALVIVRRRRRGSSSPR